MLTVLCRLQNGLIAAASARAQRLTFSRTPKKRVILSKMSRVSENLSVPTSVKGTRNAGCLTPPRDGSDIRPRRVGVKLSRTPVNALTLTLLYQLFYFMFVIYLK